MTYNPHERYRGEALREPLALAEAEHEVTLRRVYRKRLEEVGAATGLRQLALRNQEALNAAYDLFRFHIGWLEGGRDEALTQWEARRREVHVAFAARLGQVERGEVGT